MYKRGRRRHSDITGGGGRDRRILLLLQEDLPPFEPVPRPLAPDPGGDGESGSRDDERSERDEKLTRTTGGVPCEKTQPVSRVLLQTLRMFSRRTVVDEKGDAETDNALDETGRGTSSVSSV